MQLLLSNPRKKKRRRRQHAKGAKRTVKVQRRRKARRTFRRRRRSATTVRRKRGFAMAKRRRKSTPTVRRRRRRSSTGGRRHRRAPSRGGVGLLGFVNRDLLVAGGTAMAGFVGSTYLAGKITKWMQEKNPTKQMSPYLAPGIMAGVALAAGAMLRKKSPGLARNVAIGGLAASGGVLLNIVMANSRAQGAAGVHGYELGELVPLQMEDGSTVDGYMLDDGVTAVDGMGNMYDLEAA